MPCASILREQGALPSNSRFCLSTLWKTGGHGKERELGKIKKEDKLCTRRGWKGAGFHGLLSQHTGRHQCSVTSTPSTLGCLHRPQKAPRVWSSSFSLAGLNKHFCPLLSTTLVPRNDHITTIKLQVAGDLKQLLLSKKSGKQESSVSSYRCL